MADFNKPYYHKHSCSICHKPRVTIYNHPDTPRICPRCDVVETNHNGTMLILGPPILERHMKGEL